MIEVVNTCSTHLQKIETYCDNANLDQSLPRFWELESLGIGENEDTIRERFVQRITFKQGRYEVGLPWKKFHPPIAQQLCLVIEAPVEEAQSVP